MEPQSWEPGLCALLEALSSTHFDYGHCELETRNANAWLVIEKTVFGDCGIWAVAAMVEILFVWLWPL